MWVKINLHTFCLYSKVYSYWTNICRTKNLLYLTYKWKRHSNKNYTIHELKEMQYWFEIFKANIVIIIWEKNRSDELYSSCGSKRNHWRAQWFQIAIFHRRCRLSTRPSLYKQYEEKVCCHCVSIFRLSIQNEFHFWLGLCFRPVDRSVVRRIVHKKKTH